jgi:thiol-disulfide isomerase/thioredoxin
MKNAFIGLLFLACTAFAQSPGEITVSTLEGETLNLGALARRGPTLVTFWALWCSPCNQDTPRSVSKVRSYVAAQRFTFPVVLDPNGQLLQQFNGQVLPYSVMLDSTGGVLYTTVGYLPGDEAVIEEKLRSILGSE